MRNYPNLRRSEDAVVSTTGDWLRSAAFLKPSRLPGGLRTNVNMAKRKRNTIGEERRRKTEEKTEKWKGREEGREGRSEGEAERAQQ